MKMKDKIIIFDWGGVVENHENKRKEIDDAKIRFIKRFNNSISDKNILSRWTDETDALTGVQFGATNNEKDIKDWVNLIQRVMNINVPFDEFKKVYEEEFIKIHYYKDVVEFVHSLKDKCKIGILSNLTPFDKFRIDYQYNLSKFDCVYLSFELGLEKPDKKIYEYVLNDLKTEPKNILFIDDNFDNIMGAKECGWNTCQAFGYELDKIKESVNIFLNDV